MPAGERNVDASTVGLSKAGLALALTQRGVVLAKLGADLAVGRYLIELALLIDHEPPVVRASGL